MIESIFQYGRLGNRMIQLITAGLLAKELNIYLSPEEINLGNPALNNYPSYVDMDDFKNFFYINPKLHEGRKIYTPEIQLTNGMNIENINLSTLPLGKYKEVNICGSIHHNLQCDFFEKYFDEMKEILLFKKSVIYNEGVFVHCRIEDSSIEKVRDQTIQPIGPPKTASYEYFDYCLSKINKKGVISTASVDNPLVKKLCNKYDLKIICLPPAETIWLASGYEYQVLDAGSFSFNIGVFGRAKQKYMYWPPPEHSWTGNFPLKINDFNLVTI